MKKSAIVCFLIYCAFSFGQDLKLSRVFRSFKNNIPVAIVNADSAFFYVLRYNKEVHDFTIEKRAKPSAEIIAFTPLKLDNVNNSWFNYENLDYLFFEHHKKLYFVFEKEINSRKEIYLKVIDTLTRSSGFIELASIGQDKAWKNFELSFKRVSPNRLLIVSSQTGFNNTVKKSVQLYDIDTREVIWINKLPLENYLTGFSTAFECDDAGNLYYILVRSKIAGYKREYVNHEQVNVPVLFHDLISLVDYRDPSRPVELLRNVVNLNSIQILPRGEDITVQTSFAMYFESDSSDAKLYFLSQRMSGSRSSSTIYSVLSPLEKRLNDELTFYDGSDYKSAGDKAYTFLKQYTEGQNYYQVLERKEGYFHKEFLVWQTDLLTGQMLRQTIVPRKVLSFRNRTRYKNIGEPMLMPAEGNLSFFVLEAKDNLKDPAEPFDYHHFKKATTLWGSNIVQYTLIDGQLRKKLIYYNSGMDMVPLAYSSDAQKDVVFFLTSGKYEKFAILSLNPS